MAKESSALPAPRRHPPASWGQGSTPPLIPHGVAVADLPGSGSAAAADAATSEGLPQHAEVGGSLLGWADTTGAAWGQPRGAGAGTYGNPQQFLPPPCPLIAGDVFAAPEMPTGLYPQQSPVWQMNQQQAYAKDPRGPSPPPPPPPPPPHHSDFEKPDMGAFVDVTPPSEPKSSPRANEVHIPPVPPLTGKVPAPVPLNSHGLFAMANFRGEVPNERGRGAFAGALLTLLDRSHKGVTHINVVRYTPGEGPAEQQQFDRWSLNRLPGCTDTVLCYINTALVSVVGMKPFQSWRSLARSLGDSRSYLAHRHWQCLELKGGGKMASTVQPWQSYRTTGGHFDSLADDLLEWLLWCDSEAKQEGVADTPPASKDAPQRPVKAKLLMKHRTTALGPNLPLCDSAEALNTLVQAAWDAAIKDTDPAKCGKRALVVKVKKGMPNDQAIRPAKKGRCMMVTTVIATVSTLIAVLWSQNTLALMHGAEQSLDAAMSDTPPPAPHSDSGFDGIGFIEVGTVSDVSMGREFRRAVSYQGSFTDPVVIGGVPSSNMDPGDGAVFGIHSIDIAAKTFSFYLSVPQRGGIACDPRETHDVDVSWMIVEAGAWQSTVAGDSVAAPAAEHRGAIEAGKGLYGMCAGGTLCTPENGCDTCDSTTGFDWLEIDFSIPHLDPIVVVQLQTSHGSDWVVQRLRHVNPSGFQARQQEDGIDDRNLSNVLGWVVFGKGVGWFDVHSQRLLDFQAIRTNDDLTHIPRSIPFAGEFSQVPAIFGTLQTLRGGDPSHLRYSAKGVGACTMFVEEEMCSDAETHHVGERAGLVAIEPGLAKLRPQVDPLPTTLRGMFEVGARDDRQIVWPNGEANLQFIQTSAKFTNPIVILGPQKYLQEGRDDGHFHDGQRAARVNEIIQIPNDCRDQGASPVLADVGLTCVEAAALQGGCGLSADLHGLAPGSVPRYSFVPMLCPRTCGVCGTTIVSYLVDTPRGQTFTGIENHERDHGICAGRIPDTTDNHDSAQHLTPWLVVEAGTWAGENEIGHTKHTDSLHAASVHAVCPGCTNGCTSCGSWSTGLDWIDVQLPPLAYTSTGKPLVMSQIQTRHGRNWVTTRHRYVSNTGFGVSIQGDGHATSHATEEIGYVVFPQSNAGNLHGLHYEARRTPSTVRTRPPFPSRLVSSTPLRSDAFRCLCGVRMFLLLSGSFDRVLDGLFLPSR